MFRKPRENDTISIGPPVKPSTGRPPTPPGSIRSNPTTTMASTQSTKKPLTPRANTKTNVPMPSKTSGKKIAFSKTPGKPNTSILSFFKKVDSPFKDDSIFLAQGSQESVPSRPREVSEELLDEVSNEVYHGEGGRYNEAPGPVKRRKLSNEDIPNGKDNGPEEADKQPGMGASSTKTPLSKKPRRSGPFLSDTDSDDDSIGDESKPREDYSMEVNQAHFDLNEEESPSIDTDTVAVKSRNRVPIAAAQAKWQALQPRSRDTSEDAPAESSGSDYGKTQKRDLKPVTKAPALIKEETSVDEWGRFEELDDFPDDEFVDGEEFVERKWMEEQARLEAAEVGISEESFNGFDDDSLEGQHTEKEMTASCPVCSANLGNITEEQATRHVNGCLDGNVVALPDPIKTEPAEAKEVKFMPPSANNRFARKATIARPGQANPIALGSGSVSNGPSTAFTAIMSGKAEDAAWASAAAAENASRGKPAHERTCPFY